MELNGTRLIAAIDLTKVEEQALHCITYELRSQFKNGYVYDEGLYHITLHLFGEETAVDSVKEIQRVLRSVAASQPPFMLVTGKPGFFGEPTGATVWIGLSDGEDALDQLHAKLEKKLVKAGYPVDSDYNTPHITIGRRIDTTAMDPPFEESMLPSMSLFAQALTLMKRTITDGVPVYEPLCSVKFSGK